MSDLSSGAYVIDTLYTLLRYESYTIVGYTIVSYNRIVKDLYPQIVLGEKCHKCLMGLDEPCPPCPVANHILWPQNLSRPHP